MSAPSRNGTLKLTVRQYVNTSSCILPHALDWSRTILEDPVFRLTRLMMRSSWAKHSSRSGCGRSERTSGTREGFLRSMFMRMGRWDV